MWRLIVFIIVAVLLVLFIGFNLQNICNISIIFYTFENVHVVMPILISFVLGILVMIPFVIRARGGSRKNRFGEREDINQEDMKIEKKKNRKNKTEQVVERVHTENETEYVPEQHL